MKIEKNKMKVMFKNIHEEESDLIKQYSNLIKQKQKTVYDEYSLHMNDKEIKEKFSVKKDERHNKSLLDRYHSFSFSKKEPRVSSSSYLQTQNPKFYEKIKNSKILTKSNLKPFVYEKKKYIPTSFHSNQHEPSKLATNNIKNIHSFNEDIKFRNYRNKIKSNFIRTKGYTKYAQYSPNKLTQQSKNGSKNLTNFLLNDLLAPVYSTQSNKEDERKLQKLLERKNQYRNNRFEDDSLILNLQRKDSMKTYQSMDSKSFYNSL